MYFLDFSENQHMPEISRFYGIIIKMFFADHNPPHFHVLYNDFNAIIEIETLSIIEGKLPPRALGMTMEWASIHQIAPLLLMQHFT